VVLIVLASVVVENVFVLSAEGLVRLA